MTGARTCVLVMGAAFAGLGQAGSAAAQAQEIVVSGRALPDAVGDRAYAIMEIDRAQLDTNASARLETTLRDVGGLAQFRRSDARSANPTSQGLNLRGLGGNAAGRVLVLRDGVPLGDPFAGYVNWPVYLPQTIGRVRVTRGGGSAANGAGALTGTVEIESVAAANSPHVALGWSRGSFGSFDAQGQVGGRLGQGGGLISMGYARGDGFVPVVALQRGPADRAAPYEQASLFGRGVFAVENGEMQVAMLVFADRRERGTGFSANLTQGADASLRFVGKRATVTGNVQLRKFAAQFAAVNAARTVTTPTLDQYNTPATGLGFRAEIRPQLRNVELRLGSEWRRMLGETNERFQYVNGTFTRIRRAGGTSDIFGGFAEVSLSAGSLTLTGGGRGDRWWLRNGFRNETPIGTGAPPVLTTLADRDGWETTARAGLALYVGGSATVRGAAYLGWRLPTLNELYRPFRIGIEQTNANAALTPERSKGAEIGFDWRPERGPRIAVTAFAMQLRDAIANITLSASPTSVVRQRVNIDGISSRGIEVDAQWRRGDWRLELSASCVDPRIVGSSLSPAQVARVQASGKVGWRGFSLTGRYVGPQYEDDANSRRLRDAFTLDASARVKIAKGLSLVARAENLLDAHVEAAISASGVIERATPRTLWIGFTFRDSDS